MVSKQYVNTFIETLSPFSYKELSKKKRSEVVKFFLTTFLICFVLTALLLLPWLITLPDKISLAMSEVDEFDIDVNFSSSSPLVLFPDNGVLEITDQNTSNSSLPLSFTTEHIIVRPAWGLEKSYVIDDFANLKTFIEKQRGLFIVLVILTLCILVPFSLVFTLAKILMLFVFSLLYCFLLTAILRKRVMVSKLSKALFFGLTPYLFINAFFEGLFVPYGWILLIAHFFWITLITLEITEVF